MPEHVRALIVILGLAAAVFAFAKVPACSVASTRQDYERRRNLWFLVTLAAFLAHDFWIYVVAVAVLLLAGLPRESNKLAMFFLLLFAVPAISAPIPGLGIMEHFFEIHYIRLLCLAVLLPAFLHLRRQPDSEPFGRSLPDKFVAGYMIVNFAVIMSASTLTNTLRIGGFYAFVGIFLPYYVASRALKNPRQFQDALMAFVVAALVLAAIGVFEFLRHWLLYNPLESSLGVIWNMGNYLERGDGRLRAQGSTGQAIPLGYSMAVAIGFILYLKRHVPNQMAWRLGLLLLIAGLIAPISRGPWVGAVAILVVFIATSPNAWANLVKLGLFGVLALPFLLLTPYGEGIIDYLPFVGTVEAHNVTFRQRLFEISVQVVMENPFFGAYGQIYSPALQELATGTGFVDIVSTYVGIALSFGLVGLSLFVGVFAAAALGIFKAMRNLPDRNDDRYFLGQSLLATLLGIMVTIATVSSITVIPVIYWSVAGVCAAYARMLSQQGANESNSPAGGIPAAAVKS